MTKEIRFCGSVDEAPSLPGAYVIAIELADSLAVTLLGQAAIELRAGRYLYCGSAKGPGGLKARLSRHNAPAAFIHPCQPIVAKQPPTGPGWTHELKHDVPAAHQSQRSMDAEVVCLDEKGVPNFDTLHSRTADHLAVACAFDLLMVNGDDLRRQPLRARKLALGNFSFFPRWHLIRRTCRRSWRPNV